MSWHLKKLLQKQLEKETCYTIRNPGGRTTIALVSPNNYTTCMGNLAVHTIYKMMNDRPDIVCERAFLPSRREALEYQRTKTPLMSLESQRPLNDFDVIAFTISFENDYLNIIPLLKLARIPHRAEERSDDMPLLIAGGAAPTLNPKPISKIFDAIVLGEAECYTNNLFPFLAERNSKAQTIEALAHIEGIWVPVQSTPVEMIQRQWIANLDDNPVQTVIYSDTAQFGNMHLIEAQRGCPFRCSFCATPELYHPPRQRSLSAIIRMIDTGLKYRKRIGLIGTHLLSHPGFESIAKAICEKGATFSLSSVRVEEIDDKKAAILAQTGHRSIALGIEAGSETLRNSLGKKLSDKRIIEAACVLAHNGITKIRLYFIIGLPGESEGDIMAIANLANKLRDIVRSNAPHKPRQVTIDCTISPFIPKPGTPLFKAPFAGELALKGKIRLLKRLFAKIDGVNISLDPISDAVSEAYLASADWEAIEFLEGTSNNRPAKELH